VILGLTSRRENRMPLTFLRVRELLSCTNDGKNYYELSCAITHQAELWLEKDGRQIGYVEYHLIGKGGLSLMKWEGIKTKMDPVLDELLGERF